MGTSLIDYLKAKIDSTQGGVRNHLQDVLDYYNSMSCEDRVIGPGKIAEICQVAPRTVNMWIDKGTLKGYRIPESEHRRTTIKELRAFMVSHNLDVNRLDNYLVTLS